jgi:hypothetical protein
MTITVRIASGRRTIRGSPRVSGRLSSIHVPFGAFPARRPPSPIIGARAFRTGQPRPVPGLQSRIDNLGGGLP